MCNLETSDLIQHAAAFRAERCRHDRSRAEIEVSGIKWSCGRTRILETFPESGRARMSKARKALRADFHKGIVLTTFVVLPILTRLSLGLRAWW